MLSLVRVFLCTLVLLAGPAMSGKAGSFLGRRASASHKSELQSRLRHSVSNLASSLQRHLQHSSNGNAVQWPVLVANARDLLDQEAERLYSPYKAALLRDYAARAPGYVLVVPMDGHRDQAHGDIGHAVSEETVIRSDGNGRTFSQTTRCRDGHCQTTNSSKAGEVGSFGNASQIAPVHSFGRFGGGSETDKASSSLHHAIQQMTNEMKSMDQSFGRGSLDDTLGSIFRDFRHRGRSAAHSEKDLTDAIHNMNMTHNSVAESVSSESHIKDGKRITRTKTCKNGHCKTVTTEEELDQSAEDEPESAFEPLFARPSFDIDDSNAFDASKLVW